MSISSFVFCAKKFCHISVCSLSLNFARSPSVVYSILHTSTRLHFSGLGPSIWSLSKTGGRVWSVSTSAGVFLPTRRLKVLSVWRLKNVVCHAAACWSGHNNKTHRSVLHLKGGTIPGVVELSWLRKWPANDSFVQTMSYLFHEALFLGQKMDPECHHCVCRIYRLVFECQSESFSNKSVQWFLCWSLTSLPYTVWLCETDPGMWVFTEPLRNVKSTVM